MGLVLLLQHLTPFPWALYTLPAYRAVVPHIIRTLAPRTEPQLGFNQARLGKN